MRPWQQQLPAIERVIRRIEIDPASGCWIWQGARYASGYGTVGRGRRGEGNVPVHRVTYEHYTGPIPEGMVPDHVCHSRDLTCRGGPTCPHRACCNPEHIEPVTRRENAQRGARVGRRWRTAA